MSGTWSGSYPVTNCYDGNDGTMCHTQSGMNQGWWAWFQLESEVCSTEIRIKNRASCCDTRLQGTVVSIRDTPNGANVWATTVSELKEVYTFATVPTPAPTPRPTSSPTPAPTPSPTPM